MVGDGIEIAAPPEFVRIAVCALDVLPITTVPKLIDAGARTSAPGVTPIPSSVALTGLPGKLPETVRSPGRSPAAAGVKTMVMEHEAPGARALPQVLAVTL